MTEHDPMPHNIVAAHGGAVYFISCGRDLQRPELGPVVCVMATWHETFAYHLYVRSQDVTNIHYGIISARIAHFVHQALYWRSYSPPTSSSSAAGSLPSCVTITSTCSASSRLSSHPVHVCRAQMPQGRQVPQVGTSPACLRCPTT